MNEQCCEYAVMGRSEFVVSIFVRAFFGFDQRLVKEMCWLVKGELEDLGFVDFFDCEMYFRKCKISSLSDRSVRS